MASSASTFAAALAAGLAADRLACSVELYYESGRECGFTAGRAEGTCPDGHVLVFTVCPKHTSETLWCTPCHADGRFQVALTIVTEVA